MESPYWTSKELPFEEFLGDNSGRTDELDVSVFIAELTSDTIVACCDSSAAVFEDSALFISPQDASRGSAPSARRTNHFEKKGEAFAEGPFGGDAPPEV
jgi:hypothetical protein